MKFNKEPKNNKIYQYRLYPTDEQKKIFAQCFGTVRFVWNWALAERKKDYELKKEIPKGERKFLSYYDQQKELVKLKQQEEFSWLYDIDSHVPEMVLNSLDEAYKHTFRRLKAGQNPGFPKFKQKKNFGKESFTTRGNIILKDETKKIISGTATVVCRAIHIPKIGNLWINIDKKTGEPIGTIKRLTVKRETTGTYSVVILAQSPIEENEKNINIDTNKILGINNGLRRFATLHTGEFIDNPEFYAESIERLRFLNRKISRLERYRKHDKNGKPIDQPSKALIKARLRYNKYMAKVVDKRERYSHIISKRLVQEWDVIVLETWSPAKLIRNNVKSLSFRIADAGWGQFRQQLDYKAKRFGKTIIKLDEYEILTKKHNECGTIVDVNYRSTEVHCPTCNKMFDIDINASINAKIAGIKLLNNSQTI